jgi:NAD(P)-dependent dehydrogenase (short-subunit alcohol dehydrogenase family)
MRLEGRVAIVTGAGRGLGRAHALALAGEGAAVVVNDLGGDVRGEGADVTPAAEVVREIERAGGRAVVSGDDVSDWAQAKRMVDTAIEAFGRLDVLVNNAGILRDRTLANMSEQEWDAVVRVHLRGHAAPTSHALAYWKNEAKRGRPVRASVVHTSSIAGYVGNFGQAHYSAAKLGIVALSRVAAIEASQYGVRSNVVSPGARTRLAATVAGWDQLLAPPADPNEFDRYAPENVSPLIVWLASADCPANSQVYHIAGNRLMVLSMPPIVHDLTIDGRWTLEALDQELPARLVEPLPISVFDFKD